MKGIISLIIMTFPGQLLLSQVTSETDWSQMDLNGKVRSVRETSYKAIKEDGVVIKGERKSENKDEKDFYILFDDNGRKAEETEYTADGKIFRRYVHIYDVNEYPTEVDWYDSEGNCFMKHTYINKYDESGMLNERDHLKKDGVVDNTATYKYDDHGNLIEYNWFRQDGILESRETYSYDEKGDVLESETYDKNGALKWKDTFKYDEQQNCIEETVFMGSKFIIRYSRKFDKYGNPTEIDWCKKDGRPYRKYYSEYKYDSNGNWIRQIQFRNEKPTYYYERELAYF